jgi:hypothetical protein
MEDIDLQKVSIVDMMSAGSHYLCIDITFSCLYILKKKLSIQSRAQVWWIQWGI